MIFNFKRQRCTRMFLSSAALIIWASAVTGLVGRSMTSSPVMNNRIPPVNAGERAAPSRDAVEDSDFLAVRAVIMSHSREIPPKTAGLLARVIIEESRRYDLDPALILAVIQTESSFRNWVRSDRDALGLMQILPTTGEAVARKINIKWEGEASLCLPVVNIRVGTYYLNQLFERFESMDLALAAYNRGPTAVTRILGRGRTPPTRYAEKVLAAYREFRPLFSSLTS